MYGAGHLKCNRIMALGLKRFKKLHWLLTEWSRRFKLSALTFNALYTTLAVLRLSDLCNNMNSRGLCIHPVLITLLFLDTAHHLAFVFFTSQHREFGTHYPLAFENLSHFLLSDVIRSQDD